ncbi:MAG: hypothetical protein ACTSRW_09115 [Candidatus Helarchaeota archaeon]
MKGVKAVLILKKDGGVLFSYEIFNQVYEQDDARLFSGFISAVHSFSREIGEKGIEFLELGHSMVFISFFSKLDLFFIVISDLKASKKQMIEFLNLIKKRFVERFGKKIGIISNVNELEMADFKEDIENVLEIDLAKRIEANLEALYF